MTARNFSNTASAATTAASITSADTVVTLNTFSGYPSAPFVAAFERGTASEEIVLVTAVAGSTVTMVRGYDGATAKSHGISSPFLHVATAADYREANAHVNATTGVHGAAGALVDTTSTQTLSNKTLTAPVVTAPTVTGGVFTGTQTMATLSVGTRATVPAPSAGTDAATKTYVDGQDAAEVTARNAAIAAAGVSAPTVNTVVRRDGAGRAQVVDPAVAADIATKGYIDPKLPAAFPLGRARQTAQVTGLASGTNIPIGFQATDVDTHAGFSGTKYTVPVGQAGTYAVQGVVAFSTTGMATGAVCQALIAKNGTAVPGSMGPSADVSGGGANCLAGTGRALLTLNAGDYVELYGYATVVWATFAAGATQSHITVERIR